MRAPTLRVAGLEPIDGHGCADVGLDGRPVEERVDVAAIDAWNAANRRSIDAYRRRPFIDWAQK